MGKIRTEVCGKEVILLSGAREATHAGRPTAIESPEKLVEAARRNPDAVAFGYFAGRWVAAA